MPAQRKIFRIEEGMTGTAAERPPVGPGRLVRAADELGAVVHNTGEAAEEILKCAGHIEEAARTLAAQIDDDSGQDLARGIGERVTRIVEACHFHDVTSQRIAKVVATLAHTGNDGPDAQDAATAHAQGEDAAFVLTGPRLADDDGHATQDDIDKLFE